MISDPDSQYIGDGTLLRADLLLRAGAFDRALQLYQGVLAQYEPMRAKVDSVLSSTKDVSVYYDKLAQQQLELLDQGDQLPPLAIRWAREAENGPLAFAVIDDINETKTLIRQSNELIDRLTALMGASNRVHAFPELEAGETAALSRCINRPGQGAPRRRACARPRGARQPRRRRSGQVRDQRRALMAAIEGLPRASPDDFGKRELQGRQQWNLVSQELTRRAMEIDALQATVNGLRRVLHDGPQEGVIRDPASLQRYQAELDASEHDLRRYRDEVVELRRDIEFGRAQIGIGDARYQNDAARARAVHAALAREVQLAGGGAAGSRGAAVRGRRGRRARRGRPLRCAARRPAMQQLESQVAARSGQLQEKVEAERARTSASTR